MNLLPVNLVLFKTALSLQAQAPFGLLDQDCSGSQYPGGAAAIATVSVTRD